MLDLHTHLWRHEPGTVLPSFDQLARFCEHAVEVGVDHVAITEHCHRFVEVANIARPLWTSDGDPELSVATEHVWQVEGGAHLDDYVEVLVAAQERGLPLLVGLEVDFLPGADPAVGELLAQYPFDVLLGSVHWLGGWLFDAYGDRVFAREWERRSVDDVWDAYVDAVIELAGSGRVDVLAHLDVIKVAGHRPRDVAGFESRLCEAIVTAGIVVEVSTAGWRKPANELYPSLTLLEALQRSGVLFTTASDAHDLNQIGYRFDDLRVALTNVGVDTLTTFKRRHSSAVAMS